MCQSDSTLQLLMKRRNFKLKIFSPRFCSSIRQDFKYSDIQLGLNIKTGLIASLIDRFTKTQGLSLVW
jgi:hypothetical protein